uniref:Uncharacterized protein n=1 Tax=Fagus sylvatica TaxID=28930 RepID=A0A2N9FAN3_FAGSY
MTSHGSLSWLISLLCLIFSKYEFGVVIFLAMGGGCLAVGCYVGGGCLAVGLVIVGL